MLTGPALSVAFISVIFSYRMNIIISNIILKKVTLKFIQELVASMLILIGIALGSGII